MISIIIATWDGWDLTRLAMECVQATTEMPIEFIIVDNGSLPIDQVDTSGWLLMGKDYAEDEKWVKDHTDVLITLDKNMGPGFAFNRGIEIGKGDAFLILNNDVLAGYKVPENYAIGHPPAHYMPHFKQEQDNWRIKGDWLHEMKSLSFSSPKIGIVSPCMNGTAAVPSDHPIENRLLPHPCAAACWLIKRQVCEVAGLFPERFHFGTYEDALFCYQAFKKGFELWVAGKAFCHHLGSQTIMRHFSRGEEVSKHMNPLVEVHEEIQFLQPQN